MNEYQFQQRPTEQTVNVHKSIVTSSLIDVNNFRTCPRNRYSPRLSPLKVSNSQQLFFASLVAIHRSNLFPRAPLRPPGTNTLEHHPAPASVDDARMQVTLEPLPIHRTSLLRLNLRRPLFPAVTPSGRDLSFTFEIARGREQREAARGLGGRARASMARGVPLERTRCRNEGGGAASKGARRME